MTSIEKNPIRVLFKVKEMPTLRCVHTHTHTIASSHSHPADARQVCHSQTDRHTDRQTPPLQTQNTQTRTQLADANHTNKRTLQSKFVTDSTVRFCGVVPAQHTRTRTLQSKFLVSHHHT
jgi:hypothetical protein